MNDRGSDQEREFLITGAKTYLDADDAMALFRRRIQGQITTLVGNRLDEIDRACKMPWTGNDIRDYSERSVDAYLLGKRLDVKNLGALYVYLKILREGKAVAYAARVDLYRLRQTIWPDIWRRMEGRAIDMAVCTGNNLFFQQKLTSEQDVADLAEYVGRALDAFIAFMSECGGIPGDA